MAFKVGAIYGEAILDTKKWSQGTASMGASLKKIGKNMAIFTAAATAAFSVFVTKSIKKANEFQKSLSNVNTLLSDGQADVAGMSRQLLLMDSALGDTIDLTDGLYQAISAGAKPGADAIDVVTQSAIFAKAALTDTATAVDVLTTATNAYGKNIISTEKAADIFFTTIKQGKINGQELSAVIGQSIPLFAGLSIPLEELSSGLAAMTKQGVSAAEATTQLNAIVNSFLKPSKIMIGQLSEMGFASGKAFIESEGLAGALKLLEDATKSGDIELSDLLTNTRALRGAMALTGEGGKEFSSILLAMGDVAGATKEAFDKQEKTWKTLQNSFGKTQILIGNVAKFFSDDLVNGLNAALTAVNKFLLSDEGFDKIAETIARTAAGFEIFKNVLKTLFDSVMVPGKIIVEEFKIFVEELAVSTDNAVNSFDVFGGMLTMVTGSIRLLMTWIGAVMKITTAWVTLYVQAGNMIKSFFDLLINKEAWSAFGKLSQAAGTSLLNLGKSFVDIFSGMFTSAITVTKVFVITILKTFKSAGKTIGAFLKALSKKGSWEEFRIQSKKTTDMLVNSGAAFSDAFGEMNKSVITGMEKLGKTSKTQGVEIEKLFSKLSKNKSWKEFRKQSEKTTSALLTLGKDYVEGYGNIISATIDLTKNFGKDAKDQAEDLRNVWVNTTDSMREKITSNYEKMILGIKKGNQEIIKDQEITSEKTVTVMGNAFLQGKALLNKFIKISLNAGRDAGQSFGEKFNEMSVKMMGKFEKNVKPVLDKVQFVAGAMAEIFNKVFETVMMGLDNELAAITLKGENELLVLEEQKENKLLIIEDENARKQEILNAKLSQGLITQEQFDVAQAALDKKRAAGIVAVDKDLGEKIADQKAKNLERENAQKKRIFEASKANQIADIWIAYALGLVGLWSSALGSMGPIVGSIVAGIATAAFTGLAIGQTVLISQQKFIPEKALGGMASGVTRIHEQGGEIVSLPDNSLVIPNDISRQIAANAGGGNRITINNNFKGAVISNEMSLNKIADFINRKLSRQLRLQT